MTDLILKRFEKPDEVREFTKGRFEIVRIGGITIGRASYEPGWRWDEHVGPTAGTATCRVEHVGLVLTGRCAVRMDSDGREVVLSAGDVFYVAPGHGSWVVGDDPYVSLHLLGANEYASESSESRASTH